MFKVGDKVIIQPNATGIAKKYIGRMATIDYMGPADVYAVVTYLPDGSYREFGCLPSEIKLCGEEKKVFTKADIKPGMAVVLGNGRVCIAIPIKDDIALASVAPSRDRTIWNTVSLRSCPELGCVGEDDYFIKEVWDLIRCEGLILDENDITKYRALLWKREDVKEVTMADVEKKFGCKVKIVGETDGE